VAGDAQRFAVAQRIRPATRQRSPVVSVPAPSRKIRVAAARMPAGPTSAFALVACVRTGRFLGGLRKGQLALLWSCSSRQFFYVKQGDQFFHRPDVTRNPCFHCGCHP